jgi:small-conductance mechanosensitive channel
MNEMTQQLINWVASIAPNRYVQALIVVLVFLVAAKIVNLFITRVLRRFVGRTRGQFDDQLIDMVERPIFLTVVLVGLSIATKLLALPDTASKVTLALLTTFVVFIWSAFLIRLTRLVLTTISGLPNRFRMVQKQTLPLFNNLATIIIVAVALYFIFIAWNINITAWVASAGIIGIAISFAAKDTLSNLFSGVFILADAPYKIGDFIILDSGERGMVTHIGIRSTRLLTRDDVEITVPNGVMGNAKITNEAGGPYANRRIRVKVGVAYGSDIDQVRAVLLDVAENNPAVCKDPEPRVRFRAFGESGLDIELLCWIDEPVLTGRVLDSLNTEVYKRFQAEGIEIPYPKRDVYFHSKQAPAAGGTD